MLRIRRRQITHAVGLCTAVLLAASCAQQTVPATGSQGPPSLDWTTEIVDDTIVVSLADPQGFYRVEQVTLIGPNGQRIDASEISRRGGGVGGSAGPTSSARVGVGSGGVSGVGIGFEFPMTAGQSRAATANETEARVPLPDPAAYRRAPQLWRIAIAVTDVNGNASRAEFPAPTAE